MSSDNIANVVGGQLENALEELSKQVGITDLVHRPPAE